MRVRKSEPMAMLKRSMCAPSTMLHAGMLGMLRWHTDTRHDKAAKNTRERHLHRGPCEPPHSLRSCSLRTRTFSSPYPLSDASVAARTASADEWAYLVLAVGVDVTSLRASSVLNVRHHGIGAAVFLWHRSGSRDLEGGGDCAHAVAHPHVTVRHVRCARGKSTHVGMIF